MFDIIIKNGVIIDGSGKSMYRGDVGIKDDEISEIGELNNDKAEIEIDAEGKYVAPGFIDVNNHSDTKWRIFADPNLRSLIHQGITTIIGGNCGSSLAPLDNFEMIKAIRKWLDVTKININWVTMKEFLKEVERTRLAVNFGTLVGHSTMRRGIVGDSIDNMEDIELQEMKRLIQKSLKEGALGLSVGLAYSHAKLASQKELQELAKLIASRKKIYTAHIRDESDSILESLDEMIEIAKETNVKLQISHLKIMGEKNWSLMDEALARIDKAKKEGVDIGFDVYPYTATGSVLYTFLPNWVSRGGRRIMISRLKDADIRKKIIKEMKADSIDYQKILVADYPLINSTGVHRSVSDIAKSQNKEIEEIIIDLLIASDGQIITITKILSEENLNKAIKHPLAIISSNGSGYGISHKGNGELVHPRDFGSFPKILKHYVKKMRILEWEEAINKMTGKPAERFGIKKRGVIKKGNFADIIVIDPETIEDKATINKPYQYATGIDYVVVNGKVAVENGEYLETRSGEIISF